eukprot:10295190-Heterocapsa_arctica.AAC.1
MFEQLPYKLNTLGEHLQKVHSILVPGIQAGSRAGGQEGRQPASQGPAMLDDRLDDVLLEAVEGDRPL